MLGSKLAHHAMSASPSYVGLMKRIEIVSAQTFYSC